LISATKSRPNSVRVSFYFKDNPERWCVATKCQRGCKAGYWFIVTLLPIVSKYDRRAVLAGRHEKKILRRLDCLMGQGAISVCFSWLIGLMHYFYDKQTSLASVNLCLQFPRTIWDSLLPETFTSIGII
jgi:hypothetical protein